MSQLPENLARRLTNLTIHFHDMALAYQFSKRIAHRGTQRAELADLVGQALAHLETCERPDWHQARRQFMRRIQR